MKLLFQPLYLIHSHHLSKKSVGVSPVIFFVYLPLFLKEEGEPQNDLTLCGGSITFIKKIVSIKKENSSSCVLLLHNMYSVSNQLHTLTYFHCFNFLYIHFISAEKFLVPQEKIQWIINFNITIIIQSYFKRYASLKSTL